MSKEKSNRPSRLDGDPVREHIREVLRKLTTRQREESSKRETENAAHRRVTAKVEAEEDTS